MKKIVLFILGPIWSFAQPNTEVYVFDLEVVGDSIVLNNGINISNNEGYDNQPSFYDDNTILFSSTRNGQTDIRQYQIDQGKTKWLTNTPVGSEYSPTRIPNKSTISAIRLDTTGLQRLYEYDTASGESKIVVEGAKIGYHLWYDEHILVNTVLMDNRMDLVVSNIKEKSNQVLQKQVGRNVLKIPGSNKISYVSKEKGTNLLKSMDMVSGSMDSIVRTNSAEDFAWTSNGLLLTGYENMLMKLRPGKEGQWSMAHAFTDKNINTITRIAINTAGDKLVLVAEESPVKIVQKQVESYNARDLDAFVGCYAEDVWVGQFPMDTLYQGREKMRENYKSYLESVASTQVKVASRIVIGNKVIDEEWATDNGKQSHQVAIYEIKNGLIQSMNFIFEKEVDDPVPIVQKQLEAYNSRDIDAFLETYTEEVSLYNYPNQPTSQGQEEMRKGYGSFFQSTPDLHCEIKNRIVIGNKVIDEEYLTVNGRNFSAVAIYEVEKGKIAKVTFLR